MKGEHTEKVPGGKLVRVKIELDANKQPVQVQVGGDFFMHPEEFVDAVEMFLLNVDADDSEQAIVSGLNQLITDKKAELVGITAESIVHAYKTAVSNAR
jgi:hypothetical protein